MKITISIVGNGFILHGKDGDGPAWVAEKWETMVPILQKLIAEETDGREPWTGMNSGGPPVEKSGVPIEVLAERINRGAESI